MRLNTNSFSCRWPFIHGLPEPVHWCSYWTVINSGNTCLQSFCLCVAPGVGQGVWGVFSCKVQEMNLTQPEGLLGYVRRGPCESAAWWREKERLLQNGGFCVACVCVFFDFGFGKFLTVSCLCALCCARAAPIIWADLCQHGRQHHWHLRRPSAVISLLLYISSHLLQRLPVIPSFAHTCKHVLVTRRDN